MAHPSRNPTGRIGDDVLAEDLASLTSEQQQQQQQGATTHEGSISASQVRRQRSTSSPKVDFIDQEQDRRQAIQDQQFLESLSPILAPRRTTRVESRSGPFNASNNAAVAAAAGAAGGGPSSHRLSATDGPRPIPIQVANFRITRRNSEDSTVDSLAGEGTSALIDHRDQPHSLPKSPHPMQFQHSGPLQQSKGTPLKGKDLDGFVLDNGGAAKDPAVIAVADGGEMTGTAGPFPKRFTASDALRSQLYANRSRQSSGSLNDERPTTSEGRILSVTSSRRQSRAEEDVCFPILRDREDIPSFATDVPILDYHVGANANDRRRYSPLVSSTDASAASGSHPAQSGVGSPVWGYTFNFDVLEAFALEEKARSSTAREKESQDMDEKRGGGDYESTSPRALPTRPRKLSSATLGDGHLRYRRNANALNHDHTSDGSDAPFPDYTPRKDGSMPLAIGMENPKLASQDRPYRFSFYSNAMSSTIHSQTLSEITGEGQSFLGLFTGRSPKLDKTSGTPGHADPDDTSSSAKLSNEMPTWWLDVLSPTDAEMKVLGKTFGIHPLTTEDIQMEEAREKVELFRNYYFICFRSFDQNPYSPTYLEPLNMYIVVFREGTLSFHFRGTPHPQNVRRRIKHLKDYIDVTSDWISYALIDDIVDAFGPLIQSIEHEVASNDELVLIIKDAEQSDMLRRIGSSRRKVMGLLRLLGNKADVIKGLSKRCNEDWSIAPRSDIGLYLGDIQDHIITMVQNLNHYEKILSRALTNYLAQCQIEMTEANTKINGILSRITALGTILIPMNLVTGLWGMNVHVPGQIGDDPASEGYAWFLGILGVLALVAIVGGFLAYKMTRSKKR